MPATALSCDNEAVDEDFVVRFGGSGGLDGEVAVISGPRGGGAFRQVFVVVVRRLPLPRWQCRGQREVLTGLVKHKTSRAVCQRMIGLSGNSSRLRATDDVDESELEMRCNLHR